MRGFPPGEVCTVALKRPHPRGDSPSPGIRAIRAHSGLSPRAGRGEKTAQNLDVPPLPPYTSARSLQGQKN